jgi:hypothetical protein
MKYIEWENIVTSKLREDDEIVGLLWSESTIRHMAELDDNGFDGVSLREVMTEIQNEMIIRGEAPTPKLVGECIDRIRAKEKAAGLPEPVKFGSLEEAKKIAVPLPKSSYIRND